MRRTKIGDVIEIRTRLGLSYCQFTHKNQLYGSLVRVFDGRFDERPADVSEVLALSVQFSVFTPIGPWVHRGIFQFFAHAEIPDALRAFPTFKAQDFRDGPWFLWDGETSRRVGELSEAQKRMPLLRSVTDVTFVDLIEEHWTDEQEGW